MAVIPLILNRFSDFFIVRFSSKFAAKCLLQIQLHLIHIAALSCGTLSENERQSQTNTVINEKLQGTVVTYLRCGETTNNQIKTGLLLSLPVKISFKSVNIWHNYRE